MKHGAWYLILTVAVVLMLSALTYYRWHRGDWTQWVAFADTFVQKDGRVVDITTGGRSTSEGQSYGLFFALVANDKVRFQSILDWTANNLANGDLRSNLPAWLWGRAEDDDWEILDKNPATDADMWIAYSLLEAGRLWERDDYQVLGRRVLENIWNSSVLKTEDTYSVLPAPNGFVSEKGARLNPSYSPEFQMRLFQTVNPTQGWDKLWKNTLAQIIAASPLGLVPDWYLLSPDGAVVVDEHSDGRGSYDAIRTYMWSGMTPMPSLSPNDINGLAQIYDQYNLIPEVVSSFKRTFDGNAPPGFDAALLPYFAVLKQDGALETLRKRLNKNTKYGLLGSPPRYYDQMLALFGEGWDQRRYCFDKNGHIQTRWNWHRCG